ncbi:hypothetical protein [Oceanicella sp. SM1341]|uniref:hypothetical protein n=1 Tax=Oceanicella sp. SM1341 TaxID=1548889 RepID=UPI000E535855|nr:hypothetical protein [Oceanicella sp. SM1341]
MNRIARPLAAGLALLALSACGKPLGPLASVSTDEVNPTGQIIRWTSGESLTFIFAVKEAEGKTGVCGAYSTYGSGNSLFEDELLRALAIEAAGERIAHGVEFFARTGTADPGSINGTTLNCALFDTPWREAYGAVAPDIVLTQRSFYD